MIIRTTKKFGPSVAAGIERKKKDERGNMKVTCSGYLARSAIWHASDSLFKLERTFDGKDVPIARICSCISFVHCLGLQERPAEHAGRASFFVRICSLPSQRIPRQPDVRFRLSCVACDDTGIARLELISKPDVPVAQVDVIEGIRPEDGRVVTISAVVEDHGRLAFGTFLDCFSN